MRAGRGRRSGWLSFIVALAGVIVASAAQAQTVCAPLPPPTGAIIDVGPSQVAQLPGIVASAASGSTIRLAPGVYNLDGRALVFQRPNVTLRSASGNRADVVLDGNLRNGAYVSREIVSIFASNVTIADVTLRRAWDHLVHVTPPAGTNITGVTLHNLHLVDPATQGVKINPTDGVNHADHGIIRCSVIELTDVGRPLVRNDFLPCYTGGIDAHRAQGWTISDNLIEGFWCPTGLSEHGIHAWNGSRDTLVQRNVLVNNARGIGFGLGSQGHANGTIRNNFVVGNDPRLFASASGFDVGIGLESATNVKVLHNTVAATAPPFASIDWRFAATTATLTNNLVTHALRGRDGATAVAAGNLANAPLSLFVDVAAADLRLRPDALAAIDHGVSVPAGDADEDIEGESRLGGVRDVGADELVGDLSLTVRRAGAGRGRVVSGDGAIDCGAACTHDYRPGVSVALTAVPEPGSSFGGWSGAGCGATVVMNAERVCTATFVAGGPLIARQPTDRAVRVGERAVFRVEAQGRANLRYQWQRNGVVIAGATGERYVTPPARLSDGGATFRCIVSDVRGSVSSRAAVLTVRP